MIGAIIGDIVGSRFEFNNHRSKDFELFTKDNELTDDSIMTLAVADILLNNKVNDPDKIIDTFKYYGKLYPYAGYGGMFSKWLDSENPKPYNSYGNGSAMRVSPVGFYAKSLEETLELAKVTAEVSHNHPQGIKGAQSIAASIYLARNGKSKDEIREYVETEFGYNLHRTCDDIRPAYRFDVTCQGSCPQAIIAFLDSSDYESAIRLAVSLGGDSDTIACMTGGIAAAFYGVPHELVVKVQAYLSEDIIEAIERFEQL